MNSASEDDSALGIAPTPNSLTYNYLEISGHNPESSETWGFRIQYLHYKPVSNTSVQGGWGVKSISWGDCECCKGCRGGGVFDCLNILRLLLCGQKCTGTAICGMWVYEYLHTTFMSTGPDLLLVVVYRPWPPIGRSLPALTSYWSIQPDLTSHWSVYMPLPLGCLSDLLLWYFNCQTTYWLYSQSSDLRKLKFFWPWPPIWTNSERPNLHEVLEYSVLEPGSTSTCQTREKYLPLNSIIPNRDKYQLRGTSQQSRDRQLVSQLQSRDKYMPQISASNGSRPKTMPMISSSLPSAIFVLLLMISAVSGTQEDHR